MKNLLVLLTVFAVIGTASAALVPNGDFESGIGTAEGWDVWIGGGTVTAAEYTTGGNPDGYVDLDAAAGTWAGWYQITPLPLDVIGVPAGETITLQADIKNISGNLDSAGLKLEGKGGAVTESADRPGVTTSWATYSIQLETNPTNTGLIFNLMTIPADAGGASHDAFDNAQLIVGGKALFPIPFVGKGVGLATTELTWTNPDPNHPSEPVTATAYLLASDVELIDPNLGPDVFHPDVDTLTVDIPDYESAPVSLSLDKYYYWAVHVTDSGTGITVPGFTWNFQTFDTPPVVDAGADQFLLQTASPMTLTLDATASDDKSGETYLWTDITDPGDKDPATTVTINDPNLVDTTVTLTNASGVTGYYQFTLTVTDTPLSQVAADSIAVGVYGTCAEAATADPDDDYDATGDFDGNCKKGLADFAVFAAFWLDCNALRISCP